MNQQIHSLYLDIEWRMKLKIAYTLAVVEVKLVKIICKPQFSIYFQLLPTLTNPLQQDQI